MAPRFSGAAPVTGPLGSPRTVAKDALFVDHSYQRDNNSASTARIAKDFNWRYFGVLLVSDRGGGALYVIDGNNRLQAALKRADVSRVPCYVYAGLTPVEEAAIFVAVNSKRKPPSGVQVFKAMIRSKDPRALSVQASLSAVGAVVSDNLRNPDSCRCPVMLLNVHDRTGRIGLDDLLRFINESWPSDRRRYHQMVVAGCERFRRYAPKAEPMRGHDLGALVERAVNRAYHEGKDRPQSFFRVLIDIYDKRKRRAA